jgi:hypothetical protein
MKRRRGLSALLGTLALVAGCSTAQRAELHGVVRDRSTGRAIPGARVVGADGSLAQTDADGRFRLFVRHGDAADLRISAEGHSPEHVEIAGLEASVELSPIDAYWPIDPSRPSDPSQPIRPSWLDTESSHAVLAFTDGGWGEAATSATPCGESALASAHVSTSGAHLACTSCHDAPAGTVEIRVSPDTCESCHEAEARVIGGALAPSGGIAPHAGLGGGCLACHGEHLASGGDPSRACARCHGARAPEIAHAVRTRWEGSTFDTWATTRGSPPPVHDTIRSTGPSFDLVDATPRAHDRSRGAHDPRWLFATE